MERTLPAPEDPPASLTCDVSGVACPDLGTVDLIARLQLVARRSGYRLLLRGSPDALRELVLLAGLETAVPICGSGSEARRQAEEREETCRVQEERDPADAPVRDLHDLE